MTRILLITSIILFALFHSCEKEDQYKLNSEFKIVLKNFDTIPFINKDSTDKFILDVIFPRSNLGYEASDAGYHNMKNDKYYVDLFTYFRIQRGNHFLNFKIGYYYTVSLPSKSILDTSLIICNKKIPNVFLIIDTTLSKHKNNEIKKTYYCDKYGVLQYEKYSGDVYKIDTNYLKKYLK